MRRVAWRLLLLLWLAGAVVTWNVIFDGYVAAGSHDYVQRQDLFVQGRGERADIDAVMQSAVSKGLRAATRDALAWLSPAVVVVVIARVKGRAKTAIRRAPDRPRHCP